MVVSTCRDVSRNMQFDYLPDRFLAYGEYDERVKEQSSLSKGFDKILFSAGEDRFV